MSRHNSLSMFNTAPLFPDLLSAIFPLVEKSRGSSSSSPLDFLQLSESSPLPSSCVIKLTHICDCVSCKLAGVYMIEFYKAKHKNLRWEEGGLIELSNTDLPRDSVWQKLIQNKPCLFQYHSVSLLHCAPTCLPFCWVLVLFIKSAKSRWHLMEIRNQADERRMFLKDLDANIKLKEVWF